MRSRSRHSERASAAPECRLLALRTLEDVRLESAKWAKADFDQACCGAVSNVCCDVSAPRGTVFKPSAAPLVPPKPAIALTGSASLGAVGLDWQLGGLGATGGSSGGPFNSQPAAMDGSTSQLVQAMAGFGGGGATDTSQAALVGADASQQTFLAAPHA
jgi:hypothetical protein